MATWGLRNSLVNYYHGLCTRGVIDSPPNVDAILSSYAGEWLQLNEDLISKYGYGFIDLHPPSSAVSSATTSKVVSPNASFDRSMIGQTAPATKVGTPTGWKMVEAEEPPSNSSIVQKHRSIEVDFSNLSFQPSAQSFAGHADAGSGSAGGGGGPANSTPSASARWSATSQHESTPGPAHHMGSGPASPTMVYPSKGTPLGIQQHGQASTPVASVHFSPTHGSTLTSPVRNSSFTGASSAGGFFGSTDSGRFVASNDWNAPPSSIHTQNGVMRRPRSESQSSKVSIASSGGGSGNGRLASASASRAGGATLSPAQMSTQLLQSVGRSRQQLLSEQQILGTFSQTPTFEDAFDDDD